ncbi:HipA domain-containing protein [Derxia gummosa]|uniref:HipA domain-containing protein n=1 Tax=Derxia gummosa DSM 723 TaxID=1121388 RepID=A0A8B6X9W5_9BURK|nr:HipA domain-containing protein [Derxia gummosa]
MSHELHVWTGDRHIARIDHDARDDRWSLAYDADWAADAAGFPLSPALPFAPPAPGHASASVKRFIEHLLPEGRALDTALAYNGLARTNVFGLIRALGAETAGALRFTPSADNAPAITRGESGTASAPTGAATAADPTPREITPAELDDRIARHAQLPLTVWDGRLRMSVAGLQDKLLVWLDRPLAEGGRLFLVDGGRLASTHLLKPDTGDARTPHLAVNEHFCMSLARRMGLPAAEVTLLRVPRPVLVVKRFDRVALTVGGRPFVRRAHIVDACQACDLPVSHKYERNLGNAPEVSHIRDGMSFERLFGCVAFAGNKAATRLALLRWALFQFLIGNSDAHGKNFSFHVRPGGLLEPAEWYDLVGVLAYEGFDTELAMAWGDVFVHAEVSAFALADFAGRCGIDRRFMRREGRRLAKLAGGAAREQAERGGYLAEERGFVVGLADFVARQAERLGRLLDEAVAIKADYL